jgi:hypothetical protein
MSSSQKEEVFIGPLPIEEEVDHDMIMYAKHQGIKDPALLLGRMCPETCNALN